jgi:Domain of unknown function (DUF1772)
MAVGSADVWASRFLSRRDTHDACPIGKEETMILVAARFIAVFLTALALGLTATHVLEIPGKQSLSGAEWLHVQHTFYGGFAVVGGIAEVVGLLATLVVAYFVRARRTVLLLTLVCAVCLAGMLVVFAVGNNPLNQQIMGWTAETLPANWQQTRDAWDMAHTISTALAAVGLASLIASLLYDIAHPIKARISAS